MWFSYDGETFETHNTEAEAAAAARRAMEDWSDSAADNGWDELSTQVVYGKITHAVRVEPVEITDDNRYKIPADCAGLENHYLEQIAPDERRCNICGGVVSFDGTPPVPGNWGGRSGQKGTQNDAE